ncbi:hypothetical protein ACSBR1_022306 [Camellia fascicularis]
MPLYKPSFIALARSSPHTPLLISLATEDDPPHLSKISRSKSKICPRFLQDLHQKGFFKYINCNE